jgi:hypothetical protein
MRTLPSILCALALNALLVGFFTQSCSSSSPSNCVPGQQVSCPCPGGGL